MQDSDADRADEQSQLQEKVWSFAQRGVVLLVAVLVGLLIGYRLWGQAGALKEETYRKQVADGVPIRAIATFPNVTKPWIARGKLPGEIKDQLRRALLSLTDNDGLQELQADGLAEGSDEDYAFIRESMLNNYMFFRAAQTADVSHKRRSLKKRGKMPRPSDE